MKSRKILKKVSGRFRDFLASDHVSFTPFADAVKSYDLDKLRHDAKAALSVTMLSVSQAIAFASIAGLPVVYGIICAAVAAIVSPFFAGSRHTMLGPTNATAFMLFSFFAVSPGLVERGGELMPLLVVMVGILAAIGAIFRVADLLQYISRSVLVGYMTGAATLIMVNQLIPLLGVSKHMAEHSSGTFAGMLHGLVLALPRTDWVSLLIGVSAVAVALLIKKFLPKWPSFALALLVASLVFGPLIHFSVGPFGHAATFETFGFGELLPKMPNFLRTGIFADISSLLGVALAIAFLASLENTLMAKSIASATGDRADVNQDMLSVGMANIASALAGGMPASGSLTRSTLNLEAGARTRFASLFTGLYTTGAAILIAASVGWGVPLISYVPKAALAALVIMLSVSLFNIRNIRICLNSTKDDAVVLVITFFATLLSPLHVAIFVGVAVSIILFLRKASRPFLAEYEFSDEGELRAVGEKKARPIPAISIVHVEGDLFFGAADLFRTQIQRTVSDPAIQVIILRLRNARHLDATSVMALEDLIKFLRARGLHLLISGASREVYLLLKNSGVLATLQEGCKREEGETNLFLNSPSNPNLSTRDALKRAQELLGTNKADIRIFFDPNKKK